MYYIGIDPGMSGAMAVIGTTDMPHVISFNEQKYAETLQSVQFLSCVCCLEKVGAMPGQGVTSMFNFGCNFGMIQGMLIALGIPYQLKTPQAWKKEFGLNSDKSKSIEVCNKLFPNVSLLPTERSRKPNDGMAEALLMAEYARRKF